MCALQWHSLKAPHSWNPKPRKQLWHVLPNFLSTGKETKVYKTILELDWLICFSFLFGGAGRIKHSGQCADLWTVISCPDLWNLWELKGGDWVRRWAKPLLWDWARSKLLACGDWLSTGQRASVTGFIWSCSTQDKKVRSGIKMNTSAEKHVIRSFFSGLWIVNLNQCS